MPRQTTIKVYKYHELTDKKVRDVRLISRELEKLGYLILYPNLSDAEIDQEIADLDLEYTADGRVFNDRNKE